jgi:hypothetical protein
MSTARVLQVAAAVLGFALVATALTTTWKRDTPARDEPRDAPVARKRSAPTPPGWPPLLQGKAGYGGPRGGQHPQARARPPGSAGSRLSHIQAVRVLHAAGISLRSSGACGDRDRSVCTSLDGIRRSAIQGLLTLRRNSGCPIVVTGGTEAGHAKGRYSHGNGYKVDVQSDRCVTGHIMRITRYAGTRDDGADSYRARDGSMYYREPDHWDILFNPR